MSTIADFPYFEVEFTKKGKVDDKQQVTDLLNLVSQGTVTDLFAISHGWNNDMDEARGLYKEFFERVRDEINDDRPAGISSRKFAVFGILWPSKKFADEELIPSGAASFAAPGADEKGLKAQLDELKGFFDHKDANAILDKAKQLVDKIKTNPAAARHFADLIRSLPGNQEMNAEDNSDAFFKAPAAKLVETMSRPDLPAPPPKGTGGAVGFNPKTGGALGIKDFFGGVLSAARKVLNFTTYYQMKERAGVVGRVGVSQVLKQIRQVAPHIKIHLIGHSFGGRVVTSAADALDGSAATKPNSMSLLQTAFSHNGFAEKFDGKRDGFFRGVVKGSKIAGPIIITHSINDTAVGIAYPLASKLSGDDAAGFGDAKDRFGGIGRNGAQHTPEADNNSPLGPVGVVYTFQRGKLYNLKADSIITGHSDIRKKEVAHAVLSAIATN